MADADADAPVDPFPDMRARRTTARLLSELLVTPDEGLAKFRKRRMDRASKLDTEYLKSARGLVEALGKALRTSDEEPWKRLHEAWLSLGPKRPAGEASTPSPPPPGPAAAQPATEPPTSPGASPAVVAPSPPPLRVAATPDDEPESVRAPQPLPAPPPMGAPLPAAVPPPVVVPPPVRPPMSAAAPPPLTAPPPAPPPAAASPWTRGTPSTGEWDSAGTADLSSNEPQVLPFKAKADKPPPSVARTVEEATGFVSPEVMAELRQALPFRETQAQAAAVPPKAVSLQPEVPPAAPSQPGMPSLTVEQYASVCAECDIYPERITEILARYQITSDDARRVLDDHWRQAFDRAPELKKRWEQSNQQYRAWLTSQKP